MKRKFGIPATRHIDNKTFKISLPLITSKKKLRERKNWLGKRGYKYFRTFKEEGGIALYASK